MVLHRLTFIAGLLLASSLVNAETAETANYHVKAMASDLA